MTVKSSADKASRVNPPKRAFFPKLQAIKQRIKRLEEEQIKEEDPEVQRIGWEYILSFIKAFGLEFACLGGGIDLESLSTEQKEQVERAKKSYKEVKNEYKNQ